MTKSVPKSVNLDHKQKKYTLYRHPQDVLYLQNIKPIFIRTNDPKANSYTTFHFFLPQNETSHQLESNSSDHVYKLWQENIMKEKKDKIFHKDFILIAIIVIESPSIQGVTVPPLGKISPLPPPSTCGRQNCPFSYEKLGKCFTMPSIKKLWLEFHTFRAQIKDGMIFQSCLMLPDIFNTLKPSQQNNKKQLSSSRDSTKQLCDDMKKDIGMCFNELVQPLKSLDIRTNSTSRFEPGQ